MEKKITRKEAILLVATQLFSIQGYRTTSMGEIAKAAGVADGTIFYHFKTKEELFLAVLEHFKEEIISEFSIIEENDTYKSGLEKIEALLSFYIYLANRLEDRFLLLHRHFPYTLAEDNPACWNHLEEIYNTLIGVFEQAILQGQADGSIDELPARKMAMIIFTLVDGMVRLNTYNIYHTGPLYNELITSCHRMLKK